MPFQPASQVRQRPSATVHGCRLLHCPHLQRPRGSPSPSAASPKPPPATSHRARGAGSGPTVSGHSPPPAALAVEASRARLAAVFSPVARLARAGPVHLVALALVALAVPVAAGPERPLPALAAARELLAGRVVAGALVVATAAPPAGLAQAVASLLVTLGVVAAIAGAGALGSPPVGLAGAFARLLVTLAVLAEADVLAFGTPAVGVAGALACHVLALPVGVAAAHLLAVGTPELPGTFCGQSCQPQHCPWDNPTTGHQRRPPVPMGPLDRCPPLLLPVHWISKETAPKGRCPGDKARGTGKGKARASAAPSLMLRSGKSPQDQPAPPQRTPPRTRGRLPVLTGVAVGTEVAVPAAALAGPDAHLVLLAGEVPVAHGWTDGQTAGMSASATGFVPAPPIPPPSPAEQGKGCAVALRALLSCGTVTILASSRAGWMGPSPEKCHQPSATLFSSMPATSLLPPRSRASLPPASCHPARPCPCHRLHPAGASLAQLRIASTGSSGQGLPAGARGERGHGVGGLQAAASTVPLSPSLHSLQIAAASLPPPPPPLPAGHQPPKATSPSAAEGTLRWGQCPERGRRRTWDRQHRGAGRRRQIPHGPGQASLATGRGRADHPSHPPYLGVLRPTVMDTIETPKIDRLHRLGAVSLMVRAGWGGARRWGQLAGGTILPPLSWQTLSFSRPAGMLKGPRPAPGARAPNACNERLRGLMHGGLVGYMVFAAGCKLQTPRAGAQSSSGSPGARRAPWPAETAGSSTETPNQPPASWRQCRG